MSSFRISAIGTTTLTRLSTTHIHRDGHHFPVEIIIQRMDLTDTGPHLVAVARDITEREEAEKALREQKDFLNAILESEPECVKVIATDGRLLQMNRAGLAMLETGSIEDVRREGLINFVHPDDQNDFIHMSRRVLKGFAEKQEFRIVGKSGTTRWLETHASPIRDSANRIYALVGVTRDVTERKSNEAKIEFLAFHDPLTILTRCSREPTPQCTKPRAQAVTPIASTTSK